MKFHLLPINLCAFCRYPLIVQNLNLVYPIFISFHFAYSVRIFCEVLTDPFARAVHVGKIYWKPRFTLENLLKASSFFLCLFTISSSASSFFHSYPYIPKALFFFLFFFFGLTISSFCFVIPIWYPLWIKLTVKSSMQEHELTIQCAKVGGDHAS